MNLRVLFIGLALVFALSGWAQGIGGMGGGPGAGSAPGGGASGTVNSTNAVTLDGKPSTAFLEKTNTAARTPSGVVFKLVDSDDGQFFGQNIFAGHPLNYIAPGQPGCFIAGGITNADSGASYTNTILDRISTIAGGVGNWIGDLSEGSFIGAGEQCRIGDNCTHSVIVGGEVQTIEDICEWSAIVGGYHNRVVTGAGYSFLGGGFGNTNGSSWGFIGGGENNAAFGLHSAVVSGKDNYATNDFAHVFGGIGNRAMATGSVVIGNRVTNTEPWSVAVGHGTSAVTINSNNLMTLNSVTVRPNSTISYSGETEVNYTGVVTENISVLTIIADPNGGWFIDDPNNSDNRLVGFHSDATDFSGGHVGFGARVFFTNNVSAKTISFLTNSHAGDVINMDGGLRQITNMTSAVTFTGLANAGPGKQAAVKLINNSGSDHIVSYTGPIRAAVDGLTSFTVTNGQRFLLSIDIDSETNGVFLPLR